MPDVILTPAQVDRLREERLEAAYRQVFGADEAARNADQILVWADLQIAGYKNKPVFVADKTGALCPMRAAIADGRRSLLLYIEANVSFPIATQPTQNQENR